MKCYSSSTSMWLYLCMLSCSFCSNDMLLHYYCIPFSLPVQSCVLCLRYTPPTQSAAGRSSLDFQHLVNSPGTPECLHRDHHTIEPDTTSTRHHLLRTVCLDITSILLPLRNINYTEALSYHHRGLLPLRPGLTTLHRYSFVFAT